MQREAFTAGVKPGGLTTSTQIRILLCYLIKCAARPLASSEIETALISEELVNYFELSDALSDLEENKLALIQDNVYILTEKGRNIAETLVSDVPKSVRECALRAVINAQQFAKKAAQHKAEIVSYEKGFHLNCKIDDMSETIFSFSIYLPDLESAEYAKKNFIENGDNIYRVMLAGITGNTQLAASLLK